MGIREDRLKADWEETKEALECSGGNMAAAARKLGLAASTVKSRIASHPPIDPYPIVPGKSVNYSGNGAINSVWATGKNMGRVTPEQIISGITDALLDYKPPAPLKTALKGNVSLLGLLPLADLHMGMRAWNRETKGIDWDTTIATKKYRRGIDSLVSRMPRCKKTVVLVAGDLCHADNYHQSTTNPDSHHIVDVDGRYPKIFRASTDIVLFSVDRALETADEVEVVCLPGNHDAATMAGVSYCLEMRHLNNKRVTVTNSDCPHWFSEWGINMLACTHGDKLKMKTMGAYMADQGSEIWGRTKARYGFLGHLHSKTVQSGPGVQLEILPTPCAPDSYASSHGFSAMRMFQVMVYDKKTGLRDTITELLL